ncbi:MAG: phosphate regulon sensor histidine kinase PhoR [Noviherbaspirillum sp.]
MNPKLLFWVPALLRFALLLAGAAALAYFFGPVAGLAAALAGVCAMIIMQLGYLWRLSNWLDHPDTRLPDGWGAWTDIFARLYRLKREDERSRTELNEWLTRFRQAMNLLPDGVVIMDDVLFLEWCNPAAERHLGLSGERDRGMRVTNLIRSPQFIDYLILGRYEQPLTLALRDRKLILHIIPFENRRQILVTHDATEADRLEQMRRDFIANASHELRTPLTVINGFLEIAQTDAALDPKSRQSHLALMAEQGRRMQNLVEDMLSLTRLESVEYPLRPEPVRMQSLLGQVHQEAQALSAGKHAITLEVEGPDINGSVEELRSAFGNLASNAVRYTPDGGAIHISWRQGKNGPKFAVRDNGIGIRPEHISRLTERFYRVDKSRSRETRGTGLGLAIVKHVVLRHGAQLDIDSEPGKGSTFTVTFPARLVIADTVRERPVANA